MKNEKNLMQIVIAGLLSVLIIVLVLGHGERVVIVNKGYSRPPVVSSSILPQPDNNIDWSGFINDAKNELYYEFSVDDIVEVIDGDTITIRMDVKDYHEKAECKVRLAGINCPEEFDQVCYADAREYTKKFFGLNDEDKSDEYYCRYYIIFVDTDSNNRPVGYISRVKFNKDDEKIGNNIDLGGYLITSQVAYPSLHWYLDEETKHKYIPYLEIARKHIKDTIKQFEDPDVGASVWGLDAILRDRMYMKLTPYLDEKDTIKDSKVKGDCIQILFNSKDDAIGQVNFSGYSILDENSYYLRRFFIPEIVIGFSDKKEMNKAGTTPNIDIFTGTTASNRLNWQPGINTNQQPVGYMMGKSNWICDEGEFIFIRNPNRRIVMCAFWDGTKTIQLLEKTKKGKYKMNEFMNDLIRDNRKEVIDFKHLGIETPSH